MQPEATAKTRIRTLSAHSPAADRSFYDERITVLDRPLVEAEWDMMRTFVGRMEGADLRLRFGRPIDFSDEGTLRRIFEIQGGAGEISWLLDRSASIGGITHRVMISPSEAEVGLMVRSDLKRVGIGEILLRELLARSARQDLKTLSALVFRENRAALRLAAKIGFVPRQACTRTVELTFELG